MNTYEEQFIGTLVYGYPFERYMFKNPQPLNTAFSDAFLTEIFIPTYSKSYDEVYVKIAGKKNVGEITIGYSDFDESIRNTIRDMFVENIGANAYQGLYTDDEECVAELKERLNEQKILIKREYGECVIRDTFNNSIFEDEEESEKMEGWISVNDHLPKEGVPVLMYNSDWKDGVNHNGIEMGFYTKGKEDEWVQTIWNTADEYYDTTHSDPEYWRYLPEPPKEID